MLRHFLLVIVSLLHATYGDDDEGSEDGILKHGFTGVLKRDVQTFGNRIFRRDLWVRCQTYAYQHSVWAAAGRL
jgi:hypothetical protein